MTAGAWSMPGTGGFEDYARGIGAVPLLSEQEERELARRVRLHGDSAARQRLVLGNLRFVLFVARGYAGYGLPLCDLVQEGNIGLIKAIDRFDPSKGVRLISFAVHWIKSAIHEYILRNWRIVRIGTTKAQRRLFFNLRKNRHQAGPIGMAEAEQLARQLRVSLQEVLEMDARMNSADASIGHGGEAAAGSIPESLLARADDGIEALEHEQWSRHARARARQGVRTLDARSRDIIERRWLAHGEPAGLEELGARHNISAERVRQVQNRALRTLRQRIEQEVPAAA